MPLLPHDDKFFDIFDKQIHLVQEAAGRLCSSMTNGTAGSDAAKRICEIEEQGNVALEEVLERLNKVFITPLDPEDLNNLATNVDHILDNLESIAYRLDAYEIRPVPTDMAQLCKFNTDATEKLCEAFDGLKQPNLKNRWQRIAAACKDISRIEREAQIQARKSTRELLKSERDPAVLIKAKELYDRFEYTADSIKQTADILRNVIVKNS
jgi:predicted phosphate transport protein (TIGR00153 family)